MRILLYTNSFFPDPIGIAFYNVEWVEELRSLGHDVEVLTSMPYYPQWEVRPPYKGRWYVQEMFQGLRVTRTWAFVPRRQNALKRFLCELSFMATSLPVLFLHRADLVIAVTPPFAVGLGAAFHRSVCKRALWLHVQDLQVDAGEAVGFLRNAVLLRVLRMLERWSLKRADTLTTITASMQARIKDKRGAPKKVDIFPNWVDTLAMRPGPKASSFRERHKLFNRFLVLYAGNVGIHQGLDNLLEAAETLQAHSSIHFLIVGDGNYQKILVEHLQQRQLKNITLLPPQPKETLAEMLSSADVGIVSETRKMANLSMPSKVWNQMACGRPIIAVTATDTALARMLAETQAGLVVTPDDPRALAQTLTMLYSQPDQCDKMGKAGREYVCRVAEKNIVFRELPALLKGSVPPSKSFREYRLKRVMDLFLALAGFLVSSPLWILVPILIWCDDRGPIFYRQERVGRQGMRFLAYKFRSMNKMELPEYNRRQARRGDARVTRVGVWLRRTAMDEVPQLWNILKGDMSFVGPRALMPMEAETHTLSGKPVPLESINGYRRRILMRPGLTGIAQVYAARDIVRRHKFRYDALYLSRQGLCLDISLILHSGWNSVTARWEAVGRSERSRPVNPS